MEIESDVKLMNITKEEVDLLSTNELLKYQYIIASSTEG